MGIELDEYKNKNAASIISKDSLRVKILVVNANEEKIIAEDTYEICNKTGKDQNMI
jgi:acetate kinase